MQVTSPTKLPPTLANMTDKDLKIDEWSRRFNDQQQYDIENATNVGQDQNPAVTKTPKD